MLYKKKKDILQRRLQKSKEIYRIQRKFLFKRFLSNYSFFLKSKDFNSKIYRALVLNFFLRKQLSSKFSKVKIKRRCVLTNSSKSIRKFGLSRIKFKELLKSNFIPNFDKAVW
jgi:ribosomal protein S14